MSSVSKRKKEDISSNSDEEDDSENEDNSENSDDTEDVQVRMKIIFKITLR